MSSNNKRIAQNTLFLYFRMFLVMGVSLYTSRVILKTLGMEDYGIYNVVGGIVTMFSFLNGSLGAATSRYITFELGRKDYAQMNKVFNVALVIHIFIALIIILLAETIGLWFFYNKMTIPAERVDAAFWVYQISILTCFFSLTQVPYNATIIAYEQMKIYAYVGVVEVVLKLGISFLLIISPIDSLIFYAILLCILQVGLMIFYRYYSIRNFKICTINVAQLKDRKLIKEMFSYAGSDMIGSLSGLAQGQGLNLLLNLFFGPVVNAARAIAYQVQGTITQFSNNFFTAVRPQIIKSYAEGKVDEMMKLVEYSGCFSYYLLWLIAMPICLESEYILTLWLGEYPEHTREFLVLVVILCLVQALKTPRTTAYHAIGHLKLVNLVVGTILCLAFPLAYIFLKLGGNPESVFWAANICMIISEFVSMFILKRYIKYSVITYCMRVHFRCLLVTILSLIIPYFTFDKFMEPSFLRLIVTVIATTISICIVVWFVGIDKENKQKMVHIVKNKIKK